MRPAPLGQAHAIPLTELHYQLTDELILHGEVDLIAAPARLMPLFALTTPDQAEMAINAYTELQQTLRQLGCGVAFFRLALRSYVNKHGKVILCERKHFLSPDRKHFTQTPAITLSCGILIRGKVFEVSYTYEVDFPFIALANQVAIMWSSAYFCADMPFPWPKIEELAT